MISSQGEQLRVFEKVDKQVGDIIRWKLDLIWLRRIQDFTLQLYE